MKGSKLQRHPVTTSVSKINLMDHKLIPMSLSVAAASTGNFVHLYFLVSIIFDSFTTPVAYGIELQFECNDPLKCQTQKPKKNKEGEY